MKFFTIILFNLPLICFGQEHLIETGKSFDEIEFGYSTLVDVKEKYASETITDTITYSCPHTDKCGKAYGKMNSIYIKKLGIVFQGNYNDELIRQIRLYFPFKGKIDDLTKIELGKTTVKDIYKSYPNSKLTSTNGKNYWIIQNDYTSFLVTRLSTDNNYPIEHIEIENRLIKLILLNPIRNRMFIDFEKNCCMPLYAPKNEMHRNCYVEKHKGGFYYINIGGESSYKSVKNGYWKEYYPNHIIKEEGNYKKGKKVGEFKYYDKNGTLIRTKRHRRFLFW
ncbi:toxin-antitoxin system YwqK family antitoxin [Aquimarina litoralis]|uniref:toxin-antitoxin system YwqK family antitoxin n=1 Tax=Aquimarina litoralis TaxID=584605 RepID=UPI001C5984A4|nr:hypothetical protein [Aquimarina litoralis]MBW1297077.1 hypothetical protein [Aquimarina litoralis]